MSARVSTDGKFFRLGAEKFHVKGLTYGPFAPDAQGETFAAPEQTARDFQQIASLGANLVRLYYAPPGWFLDLAAEAGLKILVDVPWAKHLCFMDSVRSRRDARRAVRDAVARAKGHPAIFGYSVVNEISAEIARWSGVRKIERFIDELIDESRTVDPDSLYTFTSFPPTEFLQPENVDFVCFNVYLHERAALESYLARLQTLAHSKPLVLGEFGMDSIREGEAHKCDFLRWQIETSFTSGLAGTVVFSYTDDWFRGGLQIEDWAFGLTTRDRRPKASFQTVQQCYKIAPHFPLPESKRVSVVVATFNGSRTLKACLESLQRLNYPDYEVIVVDDGSTDVTPEIAAAFPLVRYIRQENRGLSAARNTGIAAATGEIVAFTDDDCRADEDWLYYIAGDLVRGDFAGIGGHNFLPPEDSCVSAAILASPGGPSHVMLTDRVAEHIPGCNMAFYKWALDAIGGFDPQFRKAGDDVDVCWRLQDLGYRLGFSHGGFVWHYRRPTVKAYLNQQAGYGEAEALLAQKHAEHFNSFGGGIWRGRIYASGAAGIVLHRPVIYHGVFGTGFFQRLYGSQPAVPLMLCTSLGYHAFINFPLLVLALYFEFAAPLAIASLSLSLGICGTAAAQAQLPRSKSRFWSRPLVAILFFLQPIVRGWARFKAQRAPRSAAAAVIREQPLDREIPNHLVFWTKGDVDRCGFLHLVLAALETQGLAVKPDSGWAAHDAEISGGAWARLRLTTVSEILDQGRRTIHCRIEPRWSFKATALFWSAFFVTAALVVVLRAQFPWIWMTPLILLVLHWFLTDESTILHHAVGGILREGASQIGLVPVSANSASEPLLK